MDLPDYMQDQFSYNQEDGSVETPYGNMKAPVTQKQVLKEGEGTATPEVGMQVKVHYRGWASKAKTDHLFSDGSDIKTMSETFASSRKD